MIENKLCHQNFICTFAFRNQNQTQFNEIFKPYSADCLSRNSGL